MVTQLLNSLFTRAVRGQADADRRGSVQSSRKRAPQAMMEALEPRQMMTATLWAVSLGSPAAGVHGDAVLYTSGNLHVKASLDTDEDGVVVVSAESAEAAVRAAIEGTATVDTGPVGGWLGSVETYTYDFALDYGQGTTDPSGHYNAFKFDSGTSTIGFEDLAKYGSPFDDQDHNDHSWAVNVAEVTLPSLTVTDLAAGADGVPVTSTSSSGTSGTLMIQADGTADIHIDGIASPMLTNAQEFISYQVANITNPSSLSDTLPTLGMNLGLSGVSSGDMIEIKGWVDTDLDGVIDSGVEAASVKTVILLAAALKINAIPTGGAAGDKVNITEAGDDGAKGVLIVIKNADGDNVSHAELLTATLPAGIHATFVGNIVGGGGVAKQQWTITVDSSVANGNYTIDFVAEDTSKGQITIHVAK